MAEVGAEGCVAERELRLLAPRRAGACVDPDRAIRSAEAVVRALVRSAYRRGVAVGRDCDRRPEVCVHPGVARLQGGPLLSPRTARGRGDECRPEPAAAGRRAYNGCRPVRRDGERAPEAARPGLTTRSEPRGL